MLGSVTFKAGDREYKCAFTTSAMMEYENKFNEPFLSLVDKFDGDGISKLRMSFLFDLFALAVRGCNPSLKDEEIKALADQIPAQKIITLISDAIGAAFQSEGAETKKTKPAQSKTRGAKK